jgi:LCP family protein required for cell wall assembly
MNAKHEKRIKRKNPMSGIILSLVQLLVTIFFITFIVRLSVLPLKYTMTIAGVLLFLWVLVFLSQIKWRGHAFGKFVSVLMTFILSVGTFYIYKTDSTILNVINNGNVTITGMVVVVLKDDPAKTIEDAADYKFGIQQSLSSVDTGKAIEEINTKIGGTIETTPYSGFDDQVKALYSGEVEAIIYNSAFDATIKESFADYEGKVRVLESIALTEKTVTEPIGKTNSQIVKEPFNIFISGIDVFGSISQTSRSDVNIIATINPETKQILLTTTPRDYYVKLPGVSGTKFDKLTHAGIYGIQTSMDTLAAIYDVEIENYVRVNFTSFIDIIDALGGVSVYSAQKFSAFGQDYVKGYNEMDGQKALTFARERHSFVDGDFQRGRNQLEVIKAIIKKLSSSALLTNYAGFMDTLSGGIQTDLSSSEIRSLVKMQTSDNATWNIQTISALGTPAMRYCYSYSGSKLSVDLPDEESIEVIKDYMQQVMDGEIIKVETTTN